MKPIYIPKGKAKEYKERAPVLNWLYETAKAQNTTESKSVYSGFITMIRSRPAADVVEVKHGEWVVEAYDDDNRMMIIPYIEHQHSDPFCSNCGKRALLNGAEDYVTSNYCPNCGAKMDLKEGV